MTITQIIGNRAIDVFVAEYLKSGDRDKAITSARSTADVVWRTWLGIPENSATIRSERQRVEIWNAIAFSVNAAFAKLDENFLKKLKFVKPGSL